MISNTSQKTQRRERLVTTGSEALLQPTTGAHGLDGVVASVGAPGSIPNNANTGEPVSNPASCPQSTGAVRLILSQESARMQAVYGAGDQSPFASPEVMPSASHGTHNGGANE